MLMAAGIELHHILLLDNDAEDRQIIKQELEALGLENISEADDPIAALDIMHVKPVDLLITERFLPFVWFLRTSRKRPAAYIPIIMLCAQHREADIHEATDAGVNRFVAKPVQPAELLAHICRALEEPHPFVESDDYVGPDRRHRGVIIDRRTTSENKSADMELTPEEIATLLER